MSILNRILSLPFPTFVLINAKGQIGVPQQECFNMTIDEVIKEYLTKDECGWENCSSDNLHIGSQLFCIDPYFNFKTIYERDIFMSQKPNPFFKGQEIRGPVLIFNKEFIDREEIDDEYESDDECDCDNAGCDGNCEDHYHVYKLNKTIRVHKIQV